MDEKPYAVSLVCRQTIQYHIVAPDRETAERIAMEKWQRGEPGDSGISDCSIVDTVAATEEPAEGETHGDAEVALRFLHTRERLLEQLDGELTNPTLHDAVSAEEVASHLGWVRHEDPGGGVDEPRASRALEHLCATRRVICFTRPRVRKGERGEIRLYCTPQHLERLTAALAREAL
jgi:hypothetical protein